MRNKMMWIRNMMMATMLIALPGFAWAEITVQDVWVLMPPPVAENAAAYMILKNDSDADVNISSVETDVAAKAEFHAAGMKKMEKVVVPAHGKLEFSPGANHLMLTALKKKLNAGDHVMLKLNTSDGQSVEVHAKVRDMRKMQSGHGGGHHH